jgi:anti-sigma regulatory factor (Ser/Thr protein kinase)
MPCQHTRAGTEEGRPDPRPRPRVLLHARAPAGGHSVAAFARAAAEVAAGHGLAPDAVERLARAVAQAAGLAVAHAARPDGQTGQITLAARHQDATLTISVSDDGRGTGPQADSDLALGLPRLTPLVDSIAVASHPPHAATEIRLEVTSRPHTPTGTTTHDLPQRHPKAPTRRPTPPTADEAKAPPS